MLENRLQLRRTQRSPVNELRIEAVDNELISVYASIALYEYEKHPEFPHGNPLDNFLGIVGEHCVRQCLREEGIWHRQAERKLNYWGKDPRKYDFLLKNGITLEIVTVKPYHKYCIIKESSWKRSSYAIAVQLKRLRCYSEIYDDGKYQWYEIDPAKRYPVEITDQQKISEISQWSSAPIGEAKICGYGTLEEILNLQNGWAFGEAGKFPTTEFDGRYKVLDQLSDINELWNRLK